MTVVVRPDPSNRYILIYFDGALSRVENIHQDLEFELYAEDGSFFSSGTSRDALGGLRIFSQRSNAIRGSVLKKDAVMHLADKAEGMIAAGEKRTLAARPSKHGLEVADVEDHASYPDPEDLEWRDHDEPDPGYGT